MMKTSKLLFFTVILAILLCTISGYHDSFICLSLFNVKRIKQRFETLKKGVSVENLPHVLKPGTPEHRNTGTPTNKVSFEFELG